MKKQFLSLLLSGALGFAAPFSRAQGPSQAWYEDKNWQALCRTALAIPLSPEAAQLQLEAEQGKLPVKADCDEHILYYGIGQPPAYQDALACAYTHRASKSHQYLNGAGTLAMLYANGDDVPRNYDLAFRFACEAADEGGQNNEERFGVLEALRDNKLPEGTRFDLCDEQVSGAMGGYCEEITQKIADAKRAQAIAMLKAHLPQAAQFELPTLQEAETAFEQARERGEYTGGGGSGTASFIELDQGQLREQFVINLQHFASGRIPPATAAVRERTERALQAAAAAAQNFTPDPQAWSQEPTPTSLAATQQAWQLLYAEWLRFLPLAYPKLSRDAAETELLRLRIHQLKQATRDNK